MAYISLLPLSGQPLLSSIFLFSFLVTDNPNDTLHLLLFLQRKMRPPEVTFLVAFLIPNSVTLPLYETGELFPPDVGFV